jgi:chromosome segregation protein
LRLTHIKLAGFKSFVDPTVIPVPAQLTGVVGPNGCGKSNVIDAVRWVLGESSAKHLRGETMQDVIFNGSGTRKPASRASVELAFNNELGRAAGQWSQYAEIACSTAAATPPITSTTCGCGGATSPTCSLAPASVHAPTPSSSRA